MIRTYLRDYKKMHVLNPEPLWKSFMNEHEAELILGAGILLIILLFIFAFGVVGQMDPYTNGVLA